MTLAWQILWVAIGGALGAVSRFLLSGAINQRLSDTYIPIGTIAVNVNGSAIMALCYVVLVEQKLLDEVYKPLLMTAFLGAFTTFSTFSMETVLLLQQQAIGTALLYVLANVCVSILAFSAVLYFMRLVN